MKTPIQEFYEWMEQNQYFVGNDLYGKYHELLEKEKALLIKTHGNKKVYDNQIDPTIVTGEEWYAKTFNTKER